MQENDSFRLVPWEHVDKFVFWSCIVLAAIALVWR